MALFWIIVAAITIHQVGFIMGFMLRGRLRKTVLPVAVGIASRDIRAGEVVHAGDVLMSGTVKVTRTVKVVDDHEPTIEPTQSDPQ